MSPTHTCASCHLPYIIGDIIGNIVIVSECLESTVDISLIKNTCLKVHLTLD